MQHTNPNFSAEFLKFLKKLINAREYTFAKNIHKTKEVEQIEQIIRNLNYGIEKVKGSNNKTAMFLFIYFNDINKIVVKNTSEQSNKKRLAEFKEIASKIGK